jgi:pimeloyl-ACP methyl ester carboxylesterase
MRFVLIHGGFHGAWCWDRFIPELERLGHQATAIDLPGHGARRDERSTLADRRDAIVDALQPGDVLVGHSGGGYDMTVAADVDPGRVRHMVYLAAGLPFEGKSILFATGGAGGSDAGGDVSRLMDDDTGMSRYIRPLADGRIDFFDFTGWWDFFYHDCNEATARATFAQRSPAPTGFLQETVALQNFWQADISRSYILCSEDRAKSHAKSQIVIDRLGVEPLIIHASHSPFVSCPVETANLLVAATETKPHSPIRPD